MKEMNSLDNCLQKNYPLDCMTKTNGEYTTRFTLKIGGDGQSKPAVRPGTILRYVLSRSALMGSQPPHQES